MGHGYKGGAETFHSLSDNIGGLKSKWPFANGYFGTPGKGGNSKVRNIESSNPLAESKDFYDTAAYGGLEETLGKGKYKTTMEDGTVFTWRAYSHSDGTPAVDINIVENNDIHGVKSQKIHFTQRKD